MGNSPVGHLAQRKCSRGFTVVEGLLALTILSFAMLTFSFVSTTGHANLSYGRSTMLAIQVAEQILEEIQSREYSGSGADRASYCVDDYDGLSEAAGALCDFAGDPCESDYQSMSRSVSVTPDSLTLAVFGGAVIDGKTVAVTVTDSAGESWTISRFIAEPVSP